jgi:hypothetical protein
MMQQLLTRMESWQREMDAETKAIQAKSDAMRDRRMEANTKATQQRMDTNLKDLKDEIKYGQAEMRSTLCAFRCELKETIQPEIRATIQSMQLELYETTTCREATEAEPNP